VSDYFDQFQVVAFVGEKVFEIVAVVHVVLEKALLVVVDLADLPANYYMY